MYSYSLSHPIYSSVYCFLHPVVVDIIVLSQRNFLEEAFYTLILNKLVIFHLIIVALFLIYFLYSLFSINDDYLTVIEYITTKKTIKNSYFLMYLPYKHYSFLFPIVYVDLQVDQCLSCMYSLKIKCTDKKVISK